jgi:hypothetical protein
MHEPNKFMLAFDGNVRAMKDAAHASVKGNKVLEGIRIAAWYIRKIVKAICSNGPKQLHYTKQRHLADTQVLMPDAMLANHPKEGLSIVL